jgi:hypothetical protein
MAAKYLASKQVANKDPAISPAGAQDLVAAQGTFALCAALELNDVIEMVVLPPLSRIVDVILDTPDLDTNVSPAITLSIGTMAGETYDPTLAERTVSENIVAASTAGQTGGIARGSVVGFSRIAPVESERSVLRGAGTLFCDQKLAHASAWFIDREDFDAVTFARRDAEDYMLARLTANWQVHPRFRMTYLPEAEAYVLEIPLKQGYYNYQYLVVNRETGAVDEEGLEGNWHAAGNEYQVLVYYRPFGERYDRLFGYGGANSLNRR